MMLDERPTLPVVVEKLPSKSKHDWLELTLFEGRYHHVRRILQNVGHPVSRLRRVSFGGISTEGLEIGAWRHLTSNEMNTLRSFFDT
jgi:23S rRNA pseudouridine2605 synthase